MGPNFWIPKQMKKPAWPEHKEKRQETKSVQLEGQLCRSKHLADYGKDTIFNSGKTDSRRKVAWFDTHSEDYDHKHKSRWKGPTEEAHLQGYCNSTWTGGETHSDSGHTLRGHSQDLLGDWVETGRAEARRLFSLVNTPEAEMGETTGKADLKEVPELVCLTQKAI